jgi:hypothetical protein
MTYDGTDADADGIVEADIDNDSVTTDKARVGSSAKSGPNDRPLISNSDTTVTVDAGGGQDYTSIQSAIDDCPIFLRHEYIIEVNNGDYSSEDLKVETVINGGEGAGTDAGASTNLRIRGDATTPSNVTVGSCHVRNVVGNIGVDVIGMEFQNKVPNDNEDTYCLAQGTGEVRFDDVAFSGSNATNGIVIYGPKGDLRGVDVSNTGGQGVKAKRNAQVICKDFTGTTDNPYRARENSRLVVDGDGTTANSNKFVTNKGGAIIDADADDKRHTLNYAVEVQSDNSGSRSFDSWFQNTTDAPVMVALHIEASSDATTVNTLAYQNASQSTTGLSPTAHEKQAIDNGEVLTLGPWLVPKGNYYRVEAFSDTGSYSIKRWMEYKVGSDQ